jgi:outer membrane murein-binding lipoprotein Lpp
MAKQVEAWEADDGSLYRTEDEAERFNRELARQGNSGTAGDTEEIDSLRQEVTDLKADVERWKHKVGDWKLEERTARTRAEAAEQRVKDLEKALEFYLTNGHSAIKEETK